jgi:hypothetical protein
LTLVWNTSEYLDPYQPAVLFSTCCWGCRPMTIDDQ